MIPRRLIPALLAAVAPIFSGCSSKAAGGDISPRERESLLLSNWRPPGGQTCQIEEPPSGLPAVDVVIDSGAVESAITDLWMAATSRPGYALFSIHATRDSSGAPIRVKIIESDVAERTAATLEALVSRYLRHPPPDQSSVRLKIEVGPTPRFTIGAQETCKPHLRNREQVSELLERAAPYVSGPGTARVWVFIDTRGNVRNARIETSSGNGEVDSLAMQLVYRMKFHPALQDRVAVPVWVALPVSIRRR
jgi:TonB family protein